MPGLLTLVCLVVACRGNLNLQPEAPQDAPPDTPVDAQPPTVIACGAPERFSIGRTVKHLYTAATERGFVVVTLDDSDAAFGFSYEFSGNRLVEKVYDVPIATGTFGQVGAIRVDHDARDSIDVLIAAPYGTDATKPTGTALLPLDARLQQVGPTVKHDGWLAGYGSLARSDDGDLVFLGITGGGAEIDVKTVSRVGGEAGIAHPVDASGNMLSQPTMLRTQAGYMVVWAAPGGVLAEAKAAILDESLGVTTPAAKVSRDTGFSALTPTAAYSTAARRYLFAWAYKDDPGDVVALSLRDDQLGETATQVTGTSRGRFPAIAAGKDDFLVVWQDAGTIGHLGGVRVTPDGKPTYLAIPGTGGTAAAWDLIVRNGQPVLVWLEQGGTGANLWLDPLCDPH